MFEMNSLKQNAGRTAEAGESASTMTKLYNNQSPVNIAMIGPTIHIKGEVNGEESLVIQGHVEGNINLKKNNLIIGQDGKVIATIHAHTVTIEGDLKGDIFAEERVIVKKTGKVRGNITAPQVSLEDGAKFKGSMDMDSRPTASPVTRAEPESASVHKLDPSANTEKTSVNQSSDVK